MTPYLPTCPKCGEPLEYDEVDIGVGVLTGNYGCPNCHWTPEKIRDHVCNPNTIPDCCYPPQQEATT